MFLFFMRSSNQIPIGIEEYIKNTQLNHTYKQLLIHGNPNFLYSTRNLDPNLKNTENFLAHDVSIMSNNHLS